MDDVQLPPLNCNGSQVIRSDGSKEGSDLSKNKIRKLRKYQKKLEVRQIKRAQEKARRKEINSAVDASVPPKHRKFRGNDEKLEASKKLIESLVNGPKVVIDCQYENRMTLKEKKRFAQQLRRTYSSNRAASSPLHIYLSSLPTTCDFYKICCNQNEGFEKYVLDRTDQSVWKLFENNEQLVYLTPDSKNELEEFDANKIYIIGGIVDETTAKKLSLKIAEQKHVSTARLPIDKYFTRAETGTFKQELAINQVIDIILKWHETKDWVESLSIGLPQRTGFIPKLSAPAVSITQEHL